MKKETTCSKAGESDQGSELNEKANADQPLSESEKDSVTVDQTEETQEHSFTFLRHVMEQRNEADEDGESTDEVLEFHFHKQPSQKHPTRWIIAVVAAVCVLFVGTLALLGANDIYGLFTKEGEPVEIEISSGETVSQIADSLEQNGVIHFSKLFQIYIKQQGMESQLYPGIYQLNQSTDYNTILSTLKDPSKNLGLFSFPIQEGQDLLGIAASLENQSICTADDFLVAVNDAAIYSEYSFAGDLSDQELNNHYYAMEGYLFPATYSIEKGATPEEIAQMMLGTTDQKLASVMPQIQESGYSLDEIMTMASIIQAEAGTQEDMSLISSVLHNRLNTAEDYPKLQCDPTLKYAQQLEQQGGASSKQAEAYNTYLSTGLPPGPICSPGMDAIEAALFPADSDYLYFCANTQTKECYYATTLEEHNQNLIKAGLAES